MTSRRLLEKDNSIHCFANSGTSDRFINTDKYFNYCIGLKNPIKINIVKKQDSLLATKMGIIHTEEC